MKIIGELNLDTKTSAAASNNSLFVDSADDNLKFKNSGGTVKSFLKVPIGGVVAWAKSFTNVPALTDDSYVECNGQTLSDAASPLDGDTIPDLNGVLSGTQLFLRGNSSSTGTGGADTHSHGISTSSQHMSAGGGYYSIGGSTGSGSSLPPYYEVVWLMRVK